MNWKGDIEKLFKSGDLKLLVIPESSWNPTPEKYSSHYPHIILSDDGSVTIGYFENEEAGQRNKVTKTRVSKYLKKFYPTIPDKEVDRFIAQTESIRYELKIVTTGEKIAKIMENNPVESCMTYSKERYSSDVHPTSVYGGDGGIHLAYIIDKFKKNKCIARTLIYPDKKVWNRLYGQEAILKSKLEGLGYTRGVFHGATISLIKHERLYFVAPYLDCCERRFAKVQFHPTDETKLIINKHGVALGSTSGLQDYSEL
jgi:hypothetical protein